MTRSDDEMCLPPRIIPLVPRAHVQLYEIVCRRDCTSAVRSGRMFVTGSAMCDVDVCVCIKTCSIGRMVGSRDVLSVCSFAAQSRRVLTRGPCCGMAPCSSLMPLVNSSVSPLTRQTTGLLYAACGQGGAIAVQSGRLQTYSFGCLSRAGRRGCETNKKIRLDGLVSRSDRATIAYNSCHCCSAAAEQRVQRLLRDSCGDTVKMCSVFSYSPKHRCPWWASDARSCGPIRFSA